MPTIFHNIPRDPETVAALRAQCTERGFTATCGQNPCRRARRCRGAWRADESGAAVLPPCLEARHDAVIWAIVRAEEELTGLRLLVARARKLPDPEYAAELDEFEETGQDGLGLSSPGLSR